MTVRLAHQVLRAVRGDEAMRARLQALGAQATLADIAALGAAAGYPCEAEILREAWRQDWALRWLASSANGSPTGNRASSARASPE